MVRDIYLNQDVVLCRVRKNGQEKVREGSPFSWSGKSQEMIILIRKIRELIKKAEKNKRPLYIELYVYVYVYVY